MRRTRAHVERRAMLNHSTRRMQANQAFPTPVLLNWLDSCCRSGGVLAKENQYAKPDPAWSPPVLTTFFSCLTGVYIPALRYQENEGAVLIK
jgi:hypothetical protein